jgi:Fe2+ transport system protein B
MDTSTPAEAHTLNQKKMTCSNQSRKTKPRRPSSWQSFNRWIMNTQPSLYFFLVVFFAFFAGAFFFAGMDLSPPLICMESTD